MRDLFDLANRVHGAFEHGAHEAAENALREALAEAWDEAAEKFDSDFFWHDGGREMNPYRQERENVQLDGSNDA
jgi:hypothetical protein